MKKYLQSLDDYYCEAFFNVDLDVEVEIEIPDEVKSEIVSLMNEFNSEKEHMDYSKFKTCNRFFYSFGEEKYFAEVEVFFNDDNYLQNEDLSGSQVKKLTKILNKLGLELYK